MTRFFVYDVNVNYSITRDTVFWLSHIKLWCSLKIGHN
jgi:hypothetical protein